MAREKEDFQLVQRVDFLLEQCAGKKVLHLGCTNYPYTQETMDKGMLLHTDLEKAAESVYGIDSDVESLELLKKNGFHDLIHGDLENLSEIDLDATFDIILAGEMIEHLNNPGAFLTGVRRFMNSDSRLILTTVNAYCGMRFIWYGLRGRGGRAELVHPDHVAYYSYSTLNVLLERHGMQVDRFLFYDIGKEHRPHNRWFLNALNDICVTIAPQWSDGLVAVCRLRQ
ncbi:MAG: class I SAM-dependent methyltransferase [Pyrinomonadaceae bacterium]